MENESYKKIIDPQQKVILDACTQSIERQIEDIMRNGFFKDSQCACTHTKSSHTTMPSSKLTMLTIELAVRGWVPCTQCACHDFESDNLAWLLARDQHRRNGIK